MDFDFEVVKRQIYTAYKKHDDGFFWGWGLDDFIRVIEYFYRGYEKRFGHSHPRLTTDVIENVMHQLEAPDDGGKYNPEETMDLIDLYFGADLDCDYCICHFVSGDIRIMRLFEATH